MKKIPLSLLCLLLSAISVCAQETIPIETTSTITTGTALNAGDHIKYQIADGAILYIRTGSSSNTGPAFNINNADASLTISPGGTLGTGRAVFTSTSGNNGGAIRNTSTLTLTNVDFTNNRSNNAAANTGGGAIVNNGGARIILNNVNFLNNSASVSAGAVMQNGIFTMTGGTFSGNYAETGFGGALFINSTGTSIITDVTFTGNRASTRGGAIQLPGAGAVILNNVIFTDNWAGNFGGAILGGNASAYVELNLTKVGDRDYYNYTGNIAGSGAAAASTVINNTAPTATPSNGGFYHATTSATLAFNIAEGVTLAVGAVDATNRNIDTISGAAASIFIKEGAGDLILHANNSGLGGTFYINEGRVLLGNDAATLGSVGIRTIVEDSAIGGLGRMLGLTTMNAGGAIQVGIDDAIASGTFTHSGTIVFNNGSRIGLDLFAGNQADLLAANRIDQSGTVAIELGKTETGGNFTLATWSAGGLNLADIKLTFNGANPSARNSATLSDLVVVGNALILQSNTVFGLSLHWTGLDDGAWKNHAANWSDGAPSSSEETRFLTGDSVTFGDQAALDKRNVTIGSAGVTASGMNVNATSGTYLFTGSGGITINASSVIAENKITAGGASGKLVKDGAGVLAFANDGANTFENGIEVRGGVLAYEKAAHLGFGAGQRIEFAGSGTLRADAATDVATGTLAVDVHIAAGQTAAFDTQAFDVTYAGTLGNAAASSVFAKTGEGVLTLAGDSSAFSGTARVDAGALMLASTARIGGVALVKNGAMFGGSGSAAVVTLESGGILRPGAFDAVGALGVGTLNFGAGGIVHFDLISGHASNVSLSQNSKLEAATVNLLAGAGNMSVYTINLSSVLPGVYDIGSIPTLAGAHVTYGNNIELTERQKILFDTTTNPGRLYITIHQSGNDIMLWTGTAGATWASGQNWRDSMNDAMTFNDGDAVVFKQQGVFPGSRNIDINNNVIAADMQVDDAGDYRFHGIGGITTDANIGSLAGTAGIDGKFKKAGAGTVTFENTGSNVFMGGVEISGGAIVFSDGRQLLTTGTSEIDSGIHFVNTATLRPAADTSMDNKLNIAGGRSATFDVVDAARTLVWSGTFDAASSGTLVKTGGGSLILAGDNTNAASSVTITAGGVFLGGSEAGIGGAVTVGSGAIFGGLGEAAGAVTVASGATLQVGLPTGGTPGLLTIAALSMADGSRFAGTGTLAGAAVIGGASGGLITAAIGSGDTLNITAALTGSGTMSKIGGGSLVYGGDAALGHAATQINEGAVMLRNIASPEAVSHLFELNGGWLDLSETGAGGPTNEWSSGLRLSGETGRVIGTNDQITFSTPGTVDFQIGGTTAATQGVYVVIDAGPGTVTLTGNNTYAGLTRLKSGVLLVSDNTQLGDTVLNRDVVFEGGGLYVSENIVTRRSLDFVSDGTVEVADGKTTTWAGTKGGGALTKTGAGTLELTGTLANANGATVVAGVLRGTATGLAGAILNQSVVDVVQATGTASFAGVITGDTGVVNKAGGGTLVLDNGGLITAGTFNVKEGGLVLNGAVPLAVRNQFDIALNATFAAAGESTINAPKFVNNGSLFIGRAAGGSDFGRMQINGDYSGAGKIYMDVLLNKNLIIAADQLMISGSATGGTLVFLNIESSSLVDGAEQLQIVSAAQGMDGSATFLLGERYTNGAYDLALTGDGILFTKAVPGELPAVLGIDVASILIGKASFDSLANRLALSRIQAPRGHSLWVNGLYRYDRFKSGEYDGSDAATYGVQAGMDKRWKHGTWAVTTGMFYDHAQTDMDFLGNAGSVEADADGFGAYFSYDNSSLYVDAIIRFAKEDYTIALPGVRSFATKGESWGGSLELGYAIKTKSGEKIVPYARVSYQTHDINDAKDSFERIYATDSADSLECRAGVRMWNEYKWGAKTRMVPHVGVALAREVRGDTEVTVTATRFANTSFAETNTRTFHDNRTQGTGALLEAGATLQMGRRWAVSLEGLAFMADKMENYSLNLGITYLW